MAKPQALMIQIATGDPRPISKQIVDAIQRFLHDVIALDFPPDEVQARLHREFLALAPRKSA